MPRAGEVFEKLVEIGLGRLDDDTPIDANILYPHVAQEIFYGASMGTKSLIGA